MKRLQGGSEWRASPSTVLGASSVEKLREAGCEDRHIEAITGMSPAMISRYSRFADQKRFARAGTGRLEGRTLKERKK